MSKLFNWQMPKQQSPQYSYCYSTIAGNIKIIQQGQILCRMEWLKTTTPELPCVSVELQQVIDHCWLAKTAAITLPLLIQGTTFQQKVWAALREIPIGETRSYGELAKSLNTSPRALANACRQNPFPLIIPCHRVTSKTGIGGYAGALSGTLIDIKLALLNYEKSIIHEL